MVVVSKNKEMKCFRCGKFEFKSNKNKYYSLECRYDAQSDRVKFKQELGLLKGRVYFGGVIN
jgi:late competence protein required for DNA uptake (superfamily II DNA/RNA helicase)